MGSDIKSITELNHTKKRHSPFGYKIKYFWKKLLFSSVRVPSEFRGLSFLGMWPFCGTKSTSACSSMRRGVRALGSQRPAVAPQLLSVDLSSILALKCNRWYPGWGVGKDDSHYQLDSLERTSIFSKRKNAPC